MTDTLPAIRRRKRLYQTRRQLALIAWHVANPPPGASNGEKAILAGKLTAFLTADEERQVEAFVGDDKALLRALKRRSARPWS